MTGNYMSTTEAAEKWRLSTPYVAKLCREQKIPGAVQAATGKTWKIPAEADNPGVRNQVCRPFFIDFYEL